jgi:hypothetical protein
MCRMTALAGALLPVRVSADSLYRPSLDWLLERQQAEVEARGEAPA